jgi:ABC-2 type transport system ATP-binding protein
VEAIIAQDISKVFRLNQTPVSIKERLLALGRTRHRNFTAIAPMDLTVGTGETLGILGHNGSGKSTLLKCISGIIKPTTGTIRLRGRLASLLELGAGFHPELTGRENVFINASFLGISQKEIARRLDSIVEFAELEDFIDEPVKHYSSGMYVRLGFAVAINVDPDVLLVDEVLAVGDEVFQRKCLDRVRQFQQEGRTILVVTHAADVVRQVCQRAIVLHHGKLVADAAPGEAIRVFRDHLHGTLAETTVAGESADDPLRISGVAIHHEHENERRFILPGEQLSLEVSYEARRRVEQPTLNVTVVSPEGQNVYAVDLDLLEFGVPPLQGTGTVRIDFSRVPLLDGNYTVSTRITDRQDAELAASRDGRDEFSVLNPGDARGVVAFDLRSVSTTATLQEQR